MNFKEIKQLYDRNLIANFGREDICFVHAENSRLVDTEGREYIDLLCGIGISLVGHRHPRVVARIHEQVDNLLHMHNNYYWESQGVLAEKLVKAAGIGGRVIFSNSGSEAVEAALKLARLCSDPSRRTFVSADNSFHGRTYAALSVTGQPLLKKNMGPMLTPVRHIKYNDIDDLADNVDDTVSAVIIEPVQGEGGVIPAKPEFLAAAREICDSFNVLLIFDEVQTGMGRTGQWFGWQTLGGVKPDILTVGKAIGGGMQLGAMVARDGVHEKLLPGTHGGTTLGHPVACAAGIGVFEAIEEENLLERGRTVAARISSRLEKLENKHGFIRGVRQCGLMIGMELNFPGAEVFRECGKRGVIVNCAKKTTIRILPAMTIPDEDLDKGLETLEQVMVELAP